MALQVPVVGSQSLPEPGAAIVGGGGEQGAVRKERRRRRPGRCRAAAGSSAPACGVFYQLDATDAAGTQVLRVLGGELVTVVIPDVLVRGTKTDEPGPTARSRTWENVSLWPLW